MATGNVLLQARYLAYAQCTLKVSHAIVVAKINLLVIPRAFHFLGHQRGIAGNAMTAQQVHTLGQSSVIGQCHATFSGGNDFYRMEAEDSDVAIAAVTNRLALVFTTNGVGSIFDDLEAVTLS
ncbi:hypothetical protein D3C85_1452770 [compost metagenome]